jgi:hypothetical protein
MMAGAPVVSGHGGRGGDITVRVKTPSAEPAATPAAVTILSPQGEIPLTVKGADAIARIIVRNDSDTRGTPTARVVGDKGDKPLGAPEGVVAIPRPATLAPGAIGALDLAVTGHPKLAGRLVVGLQDAEGKPVDGVREAVVGISVEQILKDEVAGQPAEPSVDLVRNCLVRKLGIHLLCGGAETTRVWITGVPRDTIRKQKIRGIGSGDGGQSAVALLRPAGKVEADDLPGPLDPAYKAEVFAEATAHGDYKASLTLDPGSDEPTQLTVAVRARDWAGWALLFLIVGACIGYRTHVFYDARRARTLLQMRLLAVRERYAAERPDAHPRMPALQSLFGSLDDTPEVPDEQACAADEKTGFVELYCQVLGAASTVDAAAFESAVAEAEGLVGRWVDVDRAMRHLQAAYDEVPAAERKGAFMTDTEDQLDLVEVPGDQAATDKLVTALEGHRVLMGHYLATHALFVGRQAGEALDPARIYRKHFKAKARIADRTPGQMQALVADLAEARAALAELPEKPPRAGRALTTQDHVDALVADGEPLPEPAKSEVPVTAASLRSSIKISDCAVFWVTLIIASVAYLATFYAGKPWGSQADWVTAFAAGYGGQLLAGVAVFPAVRSLLEKVAPAKA